MIDFGRGVSLEVIEESNLRQLWMWRNNANVWKWTRQNDLLSWDEHLAWYKRMSVDPTTQMYIVWDNGKTRGVTGLTDICHKNKRAEFSLYVAPEFQKNGYARMALSTLLDHAFVNLGLHNVWGETFETNHAATMFEQMGFKLEGVRRDYYWKWGRFIGASLYSILSNEWSYRIPDRTKKRIAQTCFDGPVT